MRASSSTAWTGPAVDRVDGVPPAIAIDQTNPVRTSRSTVGTMTELNDHLKLLFARAAQLFDRRPRCRCGTTRRRRSTPTCWRARPPRATRGWCSRFPVELPADTTAEQQEQWLAASGFTRVQAERDRRAARKMLDVVADRFRASTAPRRCA